jgi:hypothetical protein
LANENVPSLHFAVAFSGVPAGGATVCVFPDAGALRCAGAAGVGALRGTPTGGSDGGTLRGGAVGAALGTGAGAGRAETSANHVLTPPCFEHAPFCVFARV